MNRFDSFAEVEETPGAMDYDTFLSRLGVRDRQTIERHVAVCEEEPTPQHANLWKRMACFLAALASKPSGTAAERATQTRGRPLRENDGIDPGRRHRLGGEDWRAAKSLHPGFPRDLDPIDHALSDDRDHASLR